MEQPGRSNEQREAERAMIDALAELLNAPLEPARVPLPDGSHMEIDGATEDLSVLVEAWAHQGPPESAQKAKVAKDALKLAFAARLIGTGPRKILLFSCHEAARHFTGLGWEAAALREFEIEVIVVKPPDDLGERVLAAQAQPAQA
jgi:hypothetical protein